MRDHGFKIVRKRDVLPLVLLFIVLSALILVLKVVEEIFFAIAYVIGFAFEVMNGKSLREAHQGMVDDIQSMRNGIKYGGM